MNKRKSLFRELDEAISQLMRVAESEESGLVRDGRVRSAAQEFKKVAEGRAGRHATDDQGGHAHL